MKKLILLAVAAIVLLFASCDPAGIVGGDVYIFDEYYDTYSVSNLFGSASISADQDLTIGVESRVVSDIGAVSVSYANTLSRSLVDSGNVVDYRVIGDYTFLLSDDGTIIATADNETGISINSILDVTEAYFYQIQYVNNKYFFGGDNTLFVIGVDTDASGTIDLDDIPAVITTNAFTSAGAGMNDERIMLKVSPLATAVSIIHDSGSLWASKADAFHFNGTTWDEVITDEDASTGATLIKSGNYYINIQNGYRMSVDDTTGALVVETATNGFSDHSREVWALSGSYADVSITADNKYNTKMIDMTLGLTIPLTSTMMQDWYNKVYTMYDTDRWYVVLKNGNASVVHVEVVDGESTVTSNTATYSDFVDGSGLVRDFWIVDDGDGIAEATDVIIDGVNGGTDPGLAGNARYTTLP